MTVRYHVTPGGELDPCYAETEPCPCSEHHDFFNDDSAIAWKIASRLSTLDPSNKGLKDLLEAAENGEPIAFEQIAYAVQTRGVSQNRTRVGITSVKTVDAAVQDGPHLRRFEHGLDLDGEVLEDRRPVCPSQQA